MGRASAGLTIADFNDNFFIVPFDLTSNMDAYLSEDLVPAIRSGTLQLRVELNSANTLDDFVIVLFAEFSAHMTIDKAHRVEVSYNTTPI